MRNERRLVLRATKSTPSILLDAEAGQFEFSGNSLPENAAEFFKPVFEWMQQQLPTLTDPARFIFRLSYYSTSSMKAFYMVLSSIREANLMQGGAHTVEWQIVDDDEFMIEAAESFEELLELPLERVHLSTAQAEAAEQQLELRMIAGKAA